MVHGSWFRVKGSGFMVKGSGFKGEVLKIVKTRDCLKKVWLF